MHSLWESNKTSRPISTTSYLLPYPILHPHLVRPYTEASSSRHGRRRASGAHGRLQLRAPAVPTSAVHHLLQQSTCHNQRRRLEVLGERGQLHGRSVSQASSPSHDRILKHNHSIDLPQQIPLHDLRFPRSNTHTQRNLRQRR